MLIMVRLWEGKDGTSIMVRLWEGSEFTMDVHYDFELINDFGKGAGLDTDFEVVVHCDFELINGIDKVVLKGGCSHTFELICDVYYDVLVKNSSSL